MILPQLVIDNIVNLGLGKTIKRGADIEIHDAEALPSCPNPVNDIFEILTSIDLNLIRKR